MDDVTIDQQGDDKERQEKYGGITSGTFTTVAGGGEYTGEVSRGRWDGKGTYKLPGSSNTFVGTFEDGAFHGPGVLKVEGGKWVGEWRRGKMISGHFVFLDGLEHKAISDSKPWSYCSSGDPRFYIEIQENEPKMATSNTSKLKYKTPEVVTPFLPPGCFDTIDGYYDPKKFAVYSYESGKEIRMPDKKEAAWIVANCRYSPLAHEETEED